MYRYTVVSDQSLPAFERKVTEALNKGWQLAGGVSAAAVAGKLSYAQALHRWEEGK